MRYSPNLCSWKRCNFYKNPRQQIIKGYLNPSVIDWMWKDCIIETVTGDEIPSHLVLVPPTCSSSLFSQQNLLIPTPHHYNCFHRTKILYTDYLSKHDFISSPTVTHAKHFGQKKNACTTPPTNYG